MQTFRHLPRYEDMKNTQSITRSLTTTTDNNELVLSQELCLEIGCEISPVRVYIQPSVPWTWLRCLGIQGEKGSTMEEDGVQTIRAKAAEETQCY